MAGILFKYSNTSDLVEWIKKAETFNRSLQPRQTLLGELNEGEKAEETTDTSAGIPFSPESLSYESLDISSDDSHANKRMRTEFGNSNIFLTDIS